MVSNEVVLTYKRKRFSDKSNVVHGIEATDSSSDSPNLISMRISHSQAESNTCSEKLNEDNVHCFKCGAFHVNENLLDCDNCSGTYHLRCTERPFKNIPQGMWQCAACIKGQVFEESMQQQAPKSNRARNTRSTQESNIGPMKLHSNKLLLSVKSVKDSLSKVSSPPIDASASKMADVIQIDNYSNPECMVAAAGCTSRSQSTGFNCLRKSSPTFLDSSSEGKYNSGCQDDSVLMTIDLNKKVNVMCNDEHPKENCSTPLITFSRRLKKKRNMGEEFSGRDSKVGDKQLSLPSLNDFSSNGSCKHESLLLNCSVTDQSNNVSMLLGQTELCPSHVLRQDKIDEEDAGLKITATGCFPDTKIVCKIGEGFPSCREEACKLMPSNHAEHILEDSSNKVLADPTPDIIGVSLSAHKNKQLKAANINTSVESRNKLDIGANNLQKASVPCNVSEERDLSKNQELPVALASSTCPSNLELNKLYTGTVPEELSVVQHASTCLSNMEINKPSMDVAAEKIVESQNLSTSNCAVLSLDEKSKGKVKGLEWLENLDIALQDTTKDTKMSFVEQGGISCGQASNGNASHLFVAPTSIDQDASQELMNHSSALQERTFLTKMGGPGYNKLQHKEVCNASLFSDILGLSLQLSAEAPTSSVKNFRSMPSATLGGKENNIHASQFPWDVLNGNQSLLRHKQIVDNVMMGSLMLKERQASLLENSKGYLVEWSEDELDSLWIGVRRHGLDNWNAMLRDPKLFFSESRGAEDLAERWNREQKKLFNGTLMQPIRPSRLDILPSPPMNDALLSKPVVGNQYGHYGSRSSELRRLTTETRLSLGDVYFQKENVPKKDLFTMSGLGMTNVFTSENPSTGASILGGSLESPICPGIGNQNPFEAQSRRFAPEQSSLLQKNVERSSHENRSDGISAGCNLPHWLKEVVSMPPRASGPGSTGALMNANSVSLLNNEQQADTSFLGEPPLPPKDCRRGILKRRSMASGHNIGCNEPWMEARPGMHSTMGQNFLKPVSNNGGLDQNSTLDSNKKSSGPIRPSELVVIESDASSEETISDDQSSRL